MKNVFAILLMSMILVTATTLLANEKIVTKIREILPQGWTIKETKGPIGMYERAAQMMGIENPNKIPGVIFTLTDTRNKTHLPEPINQDICPYFEIALYKINLNEEQIIKYNRIVNAIYNRPQPEKNYPFRFAFQKGEYVVMKSPLWGKSASSGMDELLFKILAIIKQEVSDKKIAFGDDFPA